MKVAVSGIVVGLTAALKRVFVSLILFVSIAGCMDDQKMEGNASGMGVRVAPSDTLGVEVAPDVESLARHYTELTLVTKEPVLVDLQLAMLCRGVSQQDVDEASKRAGPHAHTSIRIFMNDAAARAFRDKVKIFPVGSVIVKEKQVLAYDRVDGQGEMSRNGASTPDGVGGMIKRPAGYDPKHGDWEYFYFENPAHVEQGKIATCVDCHRGASATDYVFGGWASAE